MKILFKGKYYSFSYLYRMINILLKSIFYLKIENKNYLDQEKHNPCNNMFLLIFLNYFIFS